MPSPKGGRGGRTGALRGGHGPSNTVLAAHLDQARAGSCPPQHVLDKIADESLTGGYRVSRKNLCKIHFIALSRNGECVSCSF